MEHECVVSQRQPNQLRKIKRLLMMPHPAFSYLGRINSYKKSDLLAFLHLPEEGTVSILKDRIQPFLDENKEELEKNIRFSGLYPRTRSSIK